MFTCDCLPGPILMLSNFIYSTFRTDFNLFLLILFVYFYIKPFALLFLHWHLNYVQQLIYLILLNSKHFSTVIHPFHWQSL